MAPSKAPPEDDESRIPADKKDSRSTQESEAIPKRTLSRTKSVKTKKYAVYAEPIPDGVDEVEWYRAYNNANSQIHVKGTSKAKEARVSGETRERAMKLVAKRANALQDNDIRASEDPSSNITIPQASLNNGNGEASSSKSNTDRTVLEDSNEKVTESNEDLADSPDPTQQVSSDKYTNAMSDKAIPARDQDEQKSDKATTAGAQDEQKSTSERKNSKTDTAARTKRGLLTFEELNAPAIAASLADPDMTSPSMGPPYTLQTSSKTNKRRLVKQVSPEAASQSSRTTIADKVKGKSRVGKKPSEQELPETTKFQPPSTFFGRHDLEKPLSFGFDPTSVPDFDPKHPFKGKDSLPTPRQEFVELSSSFEKMRVQQKVAGDEFVPDVPLEPSARSADDFNPDEKWESGPLKRFASFEPFARASPRSPISSRANSPEPKQAGKASKKKTNRGQKKKAAQQKKKAAAKEEKGKGKSTEPEGSSEPSPGASSNDGGSYCICGGPDDHRQMIACDACNIWFHCSCVGVKEGDIPLMDKYICVTCHVPELLFTTWKPMCRLEGCRMPCDLEKVPPSKYCSDEHKAKFWEAAVARAPDGPGPSRGGAITKGELKALLLHCKGDVKRFHALGKRPVLPTPVEAIDWNKILTDEEKGRLCQITADKQVLNLRSQGLKDKEKVVRMAMDRLTKAIETRPELHGVCGWDARLAMNEEEFQVWRTSPSGISVFESGVMDETFCEKRRCLRHGAWVKLTLQEVRMEDNLVHKQLNKLRNEEHEMKDRANTRAASQL